MQMNTDTEKQAGQIEKTRRGFEHKTGNDKTKTRDHDKHSIFKPKEVFDACPQLLQDM